MTDAAGVAGHPTSDPDAPAGRLAFVRDVWFGLVFTTLFTGPAALLTWQSGMGQVLGLWPPLVCVLWAGAFVCSVLTTWSETRRQSLTVVYAVLSMAVGLYCLGPIMPRTTQMFDSRMWFDSHRSDFDAAARSASSVCCEDDEQRQLPYRLRYLSIDGYVTIEDHTHYFPQWIGLVGPSAGSGGFVHSSTASPDVFDWSGMGCDDPVDLHGGSGCAG